MPVERVLAKEWLPQTTGVQRVVLHWTAGGYAPGLLDKSHYHFLIDGTGRAHRGPRAPGRYLPHVRGLNTGSVGLAVCAMAGAVEQPFRAGNYPLRDVQVERMCQAAAELLHAYDLEVSERTCLCHSEVERVYGVKQRGKWDIDRVPYRLDLNPEETHAWLRRKVEWYLDRLP